MDRQTPYAPSLIAALLASALWAVALAVSPVGYVPLVLGGLAIVVLAWAMASPVRVWPTPWPWGATLAGLVVGWSALALSHALASLALSAVPVWVRELAVLTGGELEQSPFSVELVVVLTVLVVVAEEIVWRGLALAAIRARASDVAAVLGSAALYAATQAGFGMSLPAVAAFGLGVLFGALRLWSRGLVAPTVAHLMWTTGLLWWWPLAA